MAIERAFAHRIIPVVALAGPAEAEAFGVALLAGGLPVVEVVLRTPDALTAIERLAQEPELLVGGGTVTAAAQVGAAKAAGAEFVVSPGLLDSVVHEASASGVPLLPGAVTATEVMRARELGFDTVKFFPAETSGGAAAIAALAAPLSGVRFVPTGGVSPANLSAYLGLPQVPAVGGSWMAPRDALESGDVAALTRLVGEAAAVSRGATDR